MDGLSQIDATRRDLVSDEDVDAYLALDLRRKMHAYWRAANYISVQQVCIKADPLRDKSLLAQHIRPEMLCQVRDAVALNFMYVHLNRLIKENDLSMVLVSSGSHCLAALAAQSYLEAAYSERFPNIALNGEGLRALAHSQGLPCCPGMNRKYGAAGDPLLHAYGAAFESPALLVACFIECDRAVAGTLSASWHYNKFLDPVLDGAVLPILHRSDIDPVESAEPERLGNDALMARMRIQGYEPILVDCNDAPGMHDSLAEALDSALARINLIQLTARSNGSAEQSERPRWPMLIFRTPVDWAAPTHANEFSRGFDKKSGRAAEMFFTDAKHVTQLDTWLEKCRFSNELFDEHGILRKELATLAPRGKQRLGFNVYVVDGVSSAHSSLPALHRYAVRLKSPADVITEGQRLLTTYLGDIGALNIGAKKSCFFANEETLQMRLAAIAAAFGDRLSDSSDDVEHGSVDSCPAAERLNEHILDAWSASYKITGSHTLYSCYEAFILAIDAFLKQHVRSFDDDDLNLLRSPTDLLERVLASHALRQPICAGDAIAPQAAPLDIQLSNDTARRALIPGRPNASRSYERIDDGAESFCEPDEWNQPANAALEEYNFANRHMNFERKGRQ